MKSMCEVPDNFPFDLENGIVRALTADMVKNPRYQATPTTPAEIDECRLLGVLAYSRQHGHSTECSSQPKGWHCGWIHLVQSRQALETHDRTLAEAPVSDFQVLL